MNSDWNEYTVQNLVDEEVIAKPKDGNHGSIHPKSTDYIEIGVPFIMATDMVEKGVDFKNCKYITEEMAASLRKGFAKSGDVLLSHKATIGRTCILQDHPFSTVVLTPQVTYYRVLNREVLNNKYLHYYFKSEGFQNLLNSWAGGGSTRAYLGITDQRKLPITLPPISTQRDIAKILGEIDQKIQLNQQTNETLEAMAQAIFKSWFVDFDPVHAKKEAKSAGHDPNRAAMASIAGISLDQDWDEVETALNQKLAGMTEKQRQQLTHTAELFPDEMEDSEIGDVPKNWGISEIGKEVNSVGGTTPRTKNPDYWDGGGIYWTTPKDLSDANSRILLDTDRKITEKGLDKISSGLLPIDTVLMSSRAPVGYLALSKIPVAINQGYIAMICNKKLTPEYVLLWTESNMEMIKQHAGGSTFSEISKRSFRPLPVLVPSEEILKVYSAKVKSLYDVVTENLQQNITLENLRDTLLPKLISGEVEV